MSKPKPVIRLRVKEFMRIAADNELDSDTKIAAAIGVSVTQLWRAKLPHSDLRHCSPGNVFIAGVLSRFGGPFERFFVVDTVLRGRNKKRAVLR